MTEFTSEANCNAIVEAIPDAALIVDARNMIAAANASAGDVLAASLKGNHITTCLRAPDVLEAIADTRKDGIVRQVEMIVRSQVQRTLEVHISLLGQNVEGPLALIILRDRTREEQIERMRSDFVANASHELRTPLTTLSGFIETMQGAAAKDDKARGEFLKLMKAQADRMSRLIDDLLSLSRIELDEHVLPQERVNLTDIVGQVKNLLQTLAKESASNIITDMPPHLVVRGDSSQLSQVFHNLIENALKYAASGKPVTVSGRLESGKVIVTVADQGPGIAAHHIPRLTERFYRVNVQDSRSRGGTGLGLAICKHIINRHRGRLQIDSDVGHGSRFSVFLQSENG